MPIEPRRAALAAAALAGILAGCAQLPAWRRQRSPGRVSRGYYLEALRQGKPVFRVDSRESLVVLEVRRSGRSRAWARPRGREP